MAFLRSLDIAASGITAQRRRMDVITENIVNRETTRTEEGGPYRRKLSVFREIEGQNLNRYGFARIMKSRMGTILGEPLDRGPGRPSGAKGGVRLLDIIEDESDFIPVYDPNHPDANEDGYVMMPNVNTTTEMIDAMAATRSYSANIAAFDAIKNMAQRALELGKS